MGFKVIYDDQTRDERLGNGWIHCGWVKAAEWDFTELAFAQHMETQRQKIKWCAE